MATTRKWIEYEPGNSVKVSPTSVVSKPSSFLRSGWRLSVTGTGKAGDDDLRFPTEEARDAAFDRVNTALTAYQESYTAEVEAEKAAAEATRTATENAAAAATATATTNLNNTIEDLQKEIAAGKASAKADLANAKYTQRLLNSAIAQGGALNEQEIAQVLQAIGENPVASQEKEVRYRELFYKPGLSSAEYQELIAIGKEFGADPAAQLSTGNVAAPESIGVAAQVKQVVTGFQTARTAEATRRKAESEAGLAELEKGLTTSREAALKQLTPQIEQEFTRRGLLDSGAFSAALAQAAQALAARQAEQVAGARFGEFQMIRGLGREDFLRALQAAQQNRLLQGEREFQQAGYQQQQAARQGELVVGLRQALQQAAQQESQFTRGFNLQTRGQEANIVNLLNQMDLEERRFQFQKESQPTSAERILSSLASIGGTIAGGAGAALVSKWIRGKGGYQPQEWGYQPQEGDYSAYPRGGREIPPSEFTPSGFAPPRGG